MSDIDLTRPPEPGAERDAIHVAVLPVIAGEGMYRNGKVRLADCGTAYRGEYNDCIGVVNPFRDGRVEKGDRFWLFLTPNTVTGMRHHWKHPVVDREIPPRDEHEQWLRDFSSRWNFNWDEMIQAAMSSEDYDSYERIITAVGHDLHSPEELGEDLRLFWYHMEKFTGEDFSEAHRSGVHWSCTC